MCVVFQEGEEWMTNLGMVALRSVHNAFLQEYSGGNLHASNGHRNEEETWFLVEVDAPKHHYAMYNWKHGQFISKEKGNCASATSTTLTIKETFEMISGAPYGVLNAAALKFVYDGTLLRAHPPGQDEHGCGGEVSAKTGGNPVADGNWSGWWVLDSVDEPKPGQDAWNVIGGFLAGVANKVTPADIGKLFIAIAAVL
jgi:hypothetical protein